MEFHLSKGGEHAGPFSLDGVREKLQRGEFSLDDWVWWQGRQEWSRLGQHEIFTSAQPGNQAMPAQPQGAVESLRELYAAFVGPDSAHYYVPLFDRFDQGGSRASWNWWAALLTQWWMIFRGMYLWAFLLYPFLNGALFMSLGAVAAELYPKNEGAAGTAWLLGMLASIGVTGAYGNALFHRHVRRQIERSAAMGLTGTARREWLIRKGATAAGAVILIVIIAFFCVIGILAAIAIPAYQDYTMRAKVMEGLSHTGTVKLAYEHYLAQNGAPPSSIADLGVDGSSPAYGPNIAAFSIAADHGIVVMFSGQTIGGKHVELRPLNREGATRWACTPGDLPPKYAPIDCRRAAP
ncbi:MAG: pilin [Nevskia sp.]|nr:pilin [Nevskia sp.]